MTLPAEQWLEVDDDKLLPLRVQDVQDTPFDFRAGRALRGACVDHAFTRLTPGEDGMVHAVLRGGDGSGVVLKWRAHDLPWVQVHTADRPEPELHRSALAVEPMTCPPDALQSGRDVVRLKPGASHLVQWRIRAL